MSSPNEDAWARFGLCEWLQMATRKFQCMEEKWRIFRSGTKIAGSEHESLRRDHIARHGAQTFLKPLSDSIEYSISEFEAEGSSFASIQIRGGLAREVRCPHNEVHLAVLLSGKLCVHSMDGTAIARPPHGLLSLPGAIGVQVTERAAGVAAKIRLPDGIRIWLSAQPAMSMQPQIRNIASDESANLGSLILFLASEVDRLAGVNSRTGEEHIASLERFVRRRVTHWVASQIGMPKTASATHEAILVKCDAFFRQHMSRKVESHELTEVASSSLRQIYRAYDEVLGMSPSEYGKRVRVKHAYDMIAKMGALDGTEIEWAAISGFTSKRKFVDEFGKEFGMRPKDARSAYRQLIQENEQAQSRVLPIEPKLAK